MHDFSRILARTLKFEGGWVHDPADKGGETYAGIARRYSKNWAGWLVINALKQDSTGISGLDRRLVSSSDLKHLVAEHYHNQYWKPVCANLTDCPVLAAILFDCSVHLGVQRTIRLLQAAINLLSDDMSLTIKVDGRLGPATLSALNQVLARAGNENDLIQLVQILRGRHYLEIISRDSSQRKFLRGWLRRLS